MGASRAAGTERLPARSPAPAWPEGRALLESGWPMAVVALAALAMLAWTWKTWPDVLTDIGQQLYLPWQMTEGRVLYRDLAFYNGPLSQHLNALVFWAVGSSLWTYFGINLCVLALFTALAFHVVEQVASRAAATLGCLVFVLLFAFGRYTMTGGYNWVSPYTPEVTHGLTLSLAALAAMWRYRGTHSGWLVASGGLSGAAFLTKSELSLGGTAAVLSALAMSLATADLRAPARARALAIFAAAGLAVVGAALVGLWLLMPLQQAVQGTLGSWLAAASHDVTSLRFHRHNMGLVYPAAALQTIALVSAIYLLFLVPAIGLGLFARRLGRVRVAGRIAALGASSLLVIGLFHRLPWEHAAKPFSLAMLLVAATCFFLWARQGRRAPADLDTAWLRMRQTSLAVLAGGVLIKIVLNCHIYHYGFVLAVPAMLVLAALAWDWLPRAIESRSGDGQIVRLVLLPPLVAWLAFNLHQQWRVLERINVPVSRGADAFLSDTRGAYVNSVLEFLSADTPPEATLAALPAGVNLAFLARRHDATPYTQITPTEVSLYGEARILADYQAHPPDLIALVHTDFYEFGQRFFGKDYGQSIFRWIKEQYEPVAEVGATPLESDAFGIQIFRRKAAGGDAGGT